MADSGRLSQSVTEDAVPLEPDNWAGMRTEHARQSPRSREGRGLEQQTQSLRADIPAAVSVAVCGERLQQGSNVSGSQHSEDEAMMEKDVLKGVGNAVDRAMSEAEPSGRKPPPPSSSQPSSLEMPLKALSLVPTVVSDDEIEKYRRQFPDGLNVDYYDAMILYQEDDIRHVSNFLERVNSGVLLNKVEKPKVVLYDQILPCSGSKVADVDKTLEYCTYVFLFVTKKFCGDKWTEFAGQTALMNAIDNMESRWSVVPIFTEPKRSPTFKIPPSIRSLKGIQYWNEDKFYVDSLRKLLEDKLHLRLKNEEEQKGKRKQWIRRHKESERQEKERKDQAEAQALQVLAEEERRHQQELQLRNQHFQEERNKEMQRKIQITDIKADIDRFKNQNPRDHDRHDYDMLMYLKNLRHQHNSTPANMAESGGETHGQQGMPDLQHSMSYPSYLGKQPPDPYLPFHAHMAPQQPQWPYADYRSPPAHLSAPSSHFPSPLYPSGSFSLPDTSNFSNQYQLAMQMNLSGKLPPGDAQDVGSMGLRSVDGAQPAHQAQPATPAPQTCPPGQPTGVPEDGGHAGKQTLDKGTDQVAPFTDTRDTPAGQRHPGHSNTSESAQENEKSLGPKHKDDLVEDVDPRHVSPYHQQQTPGHVAAAHFSEAIQQMPLFAHGPAHYGHGRVRAEPDGREEGHYDPRLAYGGHAWMGEGYYGYGYPQYMHPFSAPRQLPPSAYQAQHPSAYGPPPLSAFPQYCGPRPPPYQGYPGYGPQQGYPGMAPSYGTPPLPSPVPPAAPESRRNPQFPAQGYPWEPIPVSAPAPQQHQRENPPPTPPSPPPPSPAVVHHHHYHHGNQDGETPAPTINIKNAENVMIGDKITVDKGRVDGRGRPPHRHEVQEPLSAPDSRFEPVHGDVARRGQEESSSMQPPSVYYSSQWSLTGLEDQHQNQSQLTQTVSRDDRSQQQQQQETSLSSSGPSPLVGLAELPQDRMHSSQTASSFPSSSNPHFPPLQAQPQRGSTRAGGDATLYTHPVGLYNWPDHYEQERETALKRYVVGPSADDGGFPGPDDGDNTSMKRRGSRE